MVFQADWEEKHYDSNKYFSYYLLSFKYNNKSTYQQINNTKDIFDCFLMKSVMQNSVILQQDNNN